MMSDSWLDAAEAVTRMALGCDRSFYATAEDYNPPLRFSQDADAVRMFRTERDKCLEQDHAAVAASHRIVQAALDRIVGIRAERGR